jgi:PBP1b-binding outer membrane lipoprotein LpoB
MKKISLLILLALFLSSCARVSVKTSEAEGWDIKYSTLWRQIEDVSASVGDVQFNLGKASSEATPDNSVIACLLAPELSGCK